MIVVFDSNVLIPMILQAIRSTRLFSRLRAGGHEVALSPQILDEVADKLRNRQRLRHWLGLSDDEIETFLQLLPTGRSRPIPRTT